MSSQVFTHHTENVVCPRCDAVMASIQPCHEKCFKCGGELDCSD